MRWESGHRSYTAEGSNQGCRRSEGRSEFTSAAAASTRPGLPASCPNNGEVVSSSTSSWSSISGSPASAPLKLSSPKSRRYNGLAARRASSRAVSSGASGGSSTSTTFDRPSAAQGPRRGHRAVSSTHSRAEVQSSSSRMPCKESRGVHEARSPPSSSDEGPEEKQLELGECEPLRSREVLGRPSTTRSQEPAWSNCRAALRRACRAVAPVASSLAKER
mmetsp:Transcript_127437/g.354768  ORF Transcript_127437/g.354768 Transcript_127437/m.354768 type:complete len:219 (+) Transcript_127437:160-816(+)